MSLEIAAAEMPARRSSAAIVCACSTETANSRIGQSSRLLADVVEERPVPSRVRGHLAHRRLGKAQELRQLLELGFRERDIRSREGARGRPGQRMPISLQLADRRRRCRALRGRADGGRSARRAASSPSCSCRGKVSPSDRSAARRVPSPAWFRALATRAAGCTAVPPMCAPRRRRCRLALLSQS